MNIEKYMQELVNSLSCRFEQKLLYVGLQGSYLRGEATSKSDIDIMVVIDGLSISDLDCYRSIIQQLGYFEKSCGFICSKVDIANWNPMEIMHLLNSTKDYFGVLAELVPSYSEDDVRNFVKISINNLYHELCHRYIYENTNINAERLPGTYKSVFFILQSIYYLRCGKFVSKKADLLCLLEGKDYAVLERSMALSNGMQCDFNESLELLFTWCQNTLQLL